jgi:hypothetical protein
MTELGVADPIATELITACRLWAGFALDEVCERCECPFYNSDRNPVCYGCQRDEARAALLAVLGHRSRHAGLRVLAVDDGGLQPELGTVELAGDVDALQPVQLAGAVAVGVGPVVVEDHWSDLQLDADRALR